MDRVAEASSSCQDPALLPAPVKADAWSYVSNKRHGFALPNDQSQPLSLEFKALQIWQSLSCLILPHFLISSWASGTTKHTPSLSMSHVSHIKLLSVRFFVPEFFFFPAMSACYSNEHFLDRNVYMLLVFS